jgi:hypothetical protein
MEQNTEEVLFPRDDGNSSNTDYEAHSEDEGPPQARKKPKTEKKSSPAKKKSGRGKKDSSAADKNDAAVADAVAAAEPEIPARKDDTRNPENYIQLEVKSNNNADMALSVRMKKNAEFQKLMTTYCTRFVSTKHSFIKY